MKVNFKELMVEVNIGEDIAVDIRKDLGNKLHRSAGDVETFDLGHKIYYSDGEVDISDSEYDALIRCLQTTGTTIMLMKAIEKLRT